MNFWRFSGIICQGRFADFSSEVEIIAQFFQLDILSEVKIKTTCLNIHSFYLNVNEEENIQVHIFRLYFVDK